MTKSTLTINLDDKSFNINDKKIDINVIGYEEIREDRSCSEKDFTYREFEFKFQIGDVTFYETLFYEIDNWWWTAPWGDESRLVSSYYDDFIEVLKSIFGEINKEIIKLAFRGLEAVLICWAGERIKTIYINTDAVENRFKYSESQVGAFFSHVKKEAHKFGYYTEYYCDDQFNDDQFSDDQFSDDFVGKLFVDFIPPEDEDCE